MVLFIQPASPWGKHPYLPNGILAAASRLSAVGLDYSIYDENLGDELPCTLIDRATAIGIGCLGPPYVTEVLRIGRRLREQWCAQPILIGGEFVRRLAPNEFMRIFRDIAPVIQTGEEDELEAFTGKNLPSAFDLSMGSVIHGLPALATATYFRKEWCLFTSQGCVFNCNFCAADKGRPEQFRDLDALKDEVEAIAPLVRKFAGPEPKYEVYCSTLDGFQNAEKMEHVLEITYAAMRRADVRLKLRFLATAAFTCRAEERHPGVIKRFAELGVTSVGVGVDGDDEEDWRAQNKRHNNADNVRRSLSLLKEAGIQPETFMVMGLPGASPHAVLKAARASLSYARQGMRVRPYLGKSGMPGTEGWNRGTHKELLLKDPQYFREFDYGGLASPVTHPGGRAQRAFTNAAFLGTCLALKATEVGCPTQPLLPTESVSLPRQIIGHVWNRLAPQDR